MAGKTKASTSKAPEWMEHLMKHQLDLEAERQRIHREEMKEQEQRRQEQEQIRHEQEQRRNNEFREQMRSMQEILLARNNPTPSTSAAAYREEETRQQSVNIAPNNRNAKTVSFSRPPTLESDTTYTQFKVWKESWDDYEMLSELKNLPMDVQRAHFEHRDAKSYEMRYRYHRRRKYVSQNDNRKDPRTPAEKEKCGN